MKSRIRYGSDRTSKTRNNASRVGQIGTSGSAHRGTNRKKYQRDIPTSPDEIELVSHAQKNSTLQRDIVQFYGIWRKVEVTRSVELADESDKDGIDESQ